MAEQIRPESKYEIRDIIERLQELRKGFAFIGDEALLETVHQMSDSANAERVWNDLVEKFN